MRGRQSIPLALNGSAPHFSRYTMVTAGSLWHTRKNRAVALQRQQRSPHPSPVDLHTEQPRSEISAQDIPAVSSVLQPGMCCPQARKRSRAAAIQEAAEEPRPAAGGLPAQEPGSSELLSPLSTFLLSPLSSVDLSAEPLSPTTTAALQALRERQPAPAADRRGLGLDHAGARADMQGNCRVSCTGRGGTL